MCYDEGFEEGFEVCREEQQLKITKLETRIAELEAENKKLRRDALIKIIDEYDRGKGDIHDALEMRTIAYDACEDIKEGGK